MSTSRSKLGGPYGMLRVRRLQAGLTQEQLAELSGLSVRAISDIERGTTARPRRSSIALLDTALNQAGEDGDTPSSGAASLWGHHVPLPIPRQLPQAVPGFVGRERELNVLTDLLHSVESASGVVVLSAIAGTAGVGKTALAVHWAHRAAERFPDGQLYVNLRGYDPDHPVPAADVLAWFLRALGVAGPDIPPEVGERAALYRSLLADRRMLVVLDNTGSAEQVRPLLPGASSCGVLVTSRDSLAGLVARDGAVRLNIDLLPLADAVALLRALIGRRVNADPGAAEALAAQCSRLPLALRIGAELAAARPSVPLADLVSELADQQRRLNLLDAGGDPRAGVRAVFSWSYRNLDVAAARTFRLLGLHPGPASDSYAAAALTGTDLRQAEQELDLLARADLIQAAEPSRFGLHDLLRDYACELAATSDTKAQRRAALTRLFDYYLHTAAAAMVTLYPTEHQRRPDSPPPAMVVPPVTSPGAARTWLDAERASLVAAVAYAATHGWPSHAARLAATIFRYLDVGGHYAEAITMHGHARRASSQAGDRAAEAEALTNLGVVSHEQGADGPAVSYFEQAIALLRETGDRAGQARALGNLGGVELLQGRYGRAASRFQQALGLRRETGDRVGQARALSNLGRVDLVQGRYRQAAAYLEQALALCHELGDRTGQAYILNYLGCACLRQGRHRQAADYFEQALALNQQTGNRPGEAYVLTNLGLLDLRQDRHEQAMGHIQRALAVFRELGSESGEAEALNGLGEVFLATGQADRARAQHRAALGLAARVGDKYEQARGQSGLARGYHAVGDVGRARHHWGHALDLYTSLGVPEADEVRAQLAAV